jgi:hypothetical protein
MKKNITLGDDVSQWPSIFEDAELDWIPDPMVLRAAELFSAGQEYCVKELKLDAEVIWRAIEKNIDGILAFFHALMTRDRIPFIDYEATYQPFSLSRELGPIGLQVRSSRAVYNRIKAEALVKLDGFDASKLPAGTAVSLGDELLAVGYGWAPSLDGLEIKKYDIKIARFVLGGLIFGGYALAGRADHLLQNTRAKMFVTLAAKHPLETRGIKKERELFAALNRLTNKDKHLKVVQEKSPPTVLQHLLAKERYSSQGLLAEAIKLRNGRAGRRYRKWHKELRQAWAAGRRDAEAEEELRAVTKELKKRFSGKPTVLTKIKLQGEITGKAKAGVNVGVASGSVGAKGKISAKSKEVPLVVPSGLRNWFVDQFVLSRHQKILLEMSLDQSSFDDLAYGLKTAWMKKRSRI